MNGKLSRSQLSTRLGESYPEVLEKYGKGDLFLPIIGKLIEIAKVHKKTWIAFFSPLGLFCGRDRYAKLLAILLKDFKFLRGYVFAGNYLHDINKTLPVAFTIWEYSPNTNSNQLDLSPDAHAVCLLELPDDDPPKPPTLGCASRVAHSFFRSDGRKLVGSGNLVPPGRRNQC